ncbi:MAG: VPDSG-CTERM sorting domain-containing protein [Verrucomicrobiia bacterium]|jgi:hypothetical protein
MMANSVVKMLVLTGLLASAISAKAIPIYNNLAATSSGIDPVGSFGPLYDSFTSASSVQAITGLELALYGPTVSVGPSLTALNGVGPATITVGLYSDSSTTPGALIATLGTISDASISAGISDYTVSLLTDPVLAASTRYWIGLSDTGTTTEWSYSSDLSGTGVSGQYFANVNGVFPNTDSPYQMLLTTAAAAVPDAGSTAYLLGLGVAGLVVLRRKLA